MTLEQYGSFLLLSAVHNYLKKCCEDSTMKVHVVCTIHVVVD